MEKIKESLNLIINCILGLINWIINFIKSHKALVVILIIIGAIIFYIYVQLFANVESTQDPEINQDKSQQEIIQNEEEKQNKGQETE